MKYTVKDLIDDLIEDGSVFIDKYGMLIGIASDGIKVTLGYINSNGIPSPGTIAYLADHSDPESW